MSDHFKIFISYRRKGGYEMAKLIYERLKLDGYSVFFDIDTLENGNFDSELEKRVKKCKDFLLVLSPGVFDRLSEQEYDAKDDWLRQEIICALAANKNIVPLILEDFAYPRRLPADIKDITRRNSIDLNPRHFEAVYAKLKESFLLSKPHWKTRHKKRIRLSIFIISLILVSILSLKGFLIYQQKDLEAKEAMIAALRADSIRIAKEIEMERMADSMKTAMELELAQMEDSINEVKEEEMEKAADSIKQYMNKKANTAQKSQAASQGTAPKATASAAPKATASAAPKATAQSPKTSTQSSLSKTFHWGGSNDRIGQVLFGKVSSAGVKKTSCSGNGVIVKVNKATCTLSLGKTTCSYSPQMTLTNCNGKLLSIASANLTLKTSPQANEAKAMEELANELSKINFSSWVSAIRNAK